MNSKTSIIFLLFISTSVLAQKDYPNILSVRDRSTVIDEVLEERLQTILPSIMRREGIDMWLVISREYNEDPVMRTLLPSTWLAARRRTILIMYDQGSERGIECLAIARYDVGKSFKSAWNKEEQPDQWKRLIEIIEERNPDKIGINTSADWQHADGMVVTDMEELRAVLPKKYEEKLVSAEKIAVGWLETRSAREMAIYPHICRIAHEIIDEAYTENVLTPGVTPTDDVDRKSDD